VKTVLFRADANAEIGYGHVSRCFAIAKMLCEEFSAVLVSRDPDPGTAQRCRDVGVELAILPAQITLEQEPSWITGKYADRSGMITLDGYEFSPSYMKELRESGWRSVVIDDFAHAPCPADIVINHAGLVCESDYQGLRFTRYLLGPRFALIHPLFNIPFAERPLPKEGHALLCMGGSDAGNATMALLPAMEHQGVESLVVITGPGYRFLPQLKDALSKVSIPYRHLHHLPPQAVRIEMQAAAVAVLPPSTIAYEFLNCSRGQLVIHQTADNQAGIRTFLLESGLATSVQRGMGEIQPRTDAGPFDGLSGQRILKAYRRLSVCGSLRCRYARVSDMATYYHWANDPLTRSMSFHTQQIPCEDHKAWFAASLENPNRHMFVLELDGQAVCQVRFDENESEAIINVTMAPDARGRGIGAGAIALAVQAYEEIREKKRLLVAQVKGGNIPSQKVFEALRFKREAVDFDGQRGYRYSLKPKS